MRLNCPIIVTLARLIASVTLVAALAAGGCGGPTREAAGRRGQVRVAAASDLNVALGAVIAAFGASHDVDVAVSYGSSGAFYAQLLNQAPFDLFLSADLEYPNSLAARGLTLPQTEFTYAVGHLVLWAPISSPIAIERDGFTALTDEAITHLAIANPEHAPYGRAAVAALRSAGVYDRLQSKLVLGENVGQAMQFAQSGAAEAALVARSLTFAAQVKGTGRVFDVPTAGYPRIDQGGVIMRWAVDPDAARALRGYLLSADGRAILERSGFALPER
jgi:molybdate transport system substrate-binding protein